MPTIEKTYLFVKKEGGGEDHVYEESGWVPTIVADELTPYTNYRAEGGAIVDGLQATAENRVSFQTLRRNNLTATFFSCRRTGLGSETAGGWKVTYSYTSLYALSSVILHVEHEGLVTEYQGTADYNTQRLVWDIPAGDWDCCGAEYYISAKVYDIFGEFYQSAVTGIITDTFNLVNMTFDSSTNSSVTFDLDYWLDSGFASGWLDYWNENDDPDVVQPQGHFHFFDGDTQVTADGLDAGTRYLFRATIALDDGQGTEIYTAYQYASTAEPDWFNVPFFIENVDTRVMILTVNVITRVNGQAPLMPNLKYSIFPNENYSTATFQNNTWTYYLAQGERVYLKGNNSGGFGNSSRLITFTSDRKFSVGGNLMSLQSENMTSNSVEPYSFSGLVNSDLLQSVRRVTVGPKLGVRISSYGLAPFKSRAITEPMNVSNVTSIADYGMYSAFSGCTSLATAPDMPKLTRVGQHGLDRAYEVCHSLRIGSNITSVTGMDLHALEYMYYNCINLNTAYYPATSYSPDIVAKYWLANCPASGVIYVPSEAVKDAIVAAGPTVVPSGWEVEVIRR